MVGVSNVTVANLHMFMYITINVSMANIMTLGRLINYKEQVTRLREVRLVMAGTPVTIF